jgi:hypothetical protein
MGPLLSQLGKLTKGRLNFFTGNDAVNTVLWIGRYVSTRPLRKFLPQKVQQRKKKVIQMAIAQIVVIAAIKN